MLARLPSRPEPEFTRIKRAETAAAVLVRAHRMSRSSGVRKMPPPVPVRPESNPRPAPMERAAGEHGNLDKVQAAVEGGVIEDAKSIAGILLLARRLEAEGR